MNTNVITRIVSPAMTHSPPPLNNISWVIEYSMLYDMTIKQDCKIIAPNNSIFTLSIPIHDP